MTMGQLAFCLLGGLVATAIGLDGIRMRKRTGITRREVWSSGMGYMGPAKLFLVTGFIMSALSVIGLILKMLHVW